jgi:hypothetical protein
MKLRQAKCLEEPGIIDLDAEEILVDYKHKVPSVISSGQKAPVLKGRGR